MKRIHAMYWSATGTTRTIVCMIAQTLANHHGMTYEVFDFTPHTARISEKIFDQDDIVVFGTPVYAGRVPNVLLNYLRTVKGNGARAIPIVLFGNRNFDDALIELRDILEQDGFHTIAAGAFVGEHAFSTTLGAGRPNTDDLTQARTFADAVWRKLCDGSYTTPISVYGHVPIRSYYVPRDRSGNPIHILKVKPKTDLSRCDGCGVCVHICPMGSIDPAHPDMISGICIKCCACVKGCPTQAKYFDDPGYLFHKEELEAQYSHCADNVIFL